MKKFNVGIIGYGWVSGAHIAAINSTTNAQVVAVYSSRKQDPQTLREKHGREISCYTDLDQMLAEPKIHIISICSYPHFHADHIIAAANAGKHLIIEKPITLHLEDTRNVVKAIRETGVKTCVCYELRFSSQLIATKGLIDQGLLGKLHYGEVDYFHGIGPWYEQFRWNTSQKSGGSSLLSAGCHALNALLMFMDSEVLSVTTYATNSFNEIFSKYEYPTTSVTILRFANGAVGKVASVIDCFQPYYFHTHLVGSEGSLVDDKFHSNFLKTDKQGWSTLSMKLLSSGDVDDHPYQIQFQTFFDSLEKDKEMPLTSLESSIKSQFVIHASDLSVSENRTVKLSELSE